MGRDAALHHLSSYAANYRCKFFADRAAAVDCDYRSVRNADPQTALALFYYHYTFNRAGGARAGYNDIATTALAEVDAIDPERLWTVFKRECEARDIGLNARINEGAVTESAALAQEKGNLFDWVGREVTTGDGIEAAYETINAITGVGEKITRFFLRDAAWICDLEGEFDKTTGQYVQPIDVWIRRAATTLWTDATDMSDRDLSQRLATACADHNCSGIAFNQGAWYYGAKVVDGDPDQYEADITSAIAET